MRRLPVLGLGLGLLLVAVVAGVTSQLTSEAVPAEVAAAPHDSTGPTPGDVASLMPLTDEELAQQAGDPGHDAADDAAADAGAEPGEPAPAVSDGGGPGDSSDGGEDGGDNGQDSDPGQDYGALVAAIDGLLDRNMPGVFGLALVAPNGELVYGRDADRPLIPASTQKLVTAATTIEKLGPDFRLKTRLLATGPVKDGVLHGDLVLVGSGDPTLGDPRWGRVVPNRPRTPLESLAKQVAEAGIREVTGQVIGHAGVLPWQPEADGWKPSYIQRGYASRSSGLTSNGGRRLWESRGQVQGAPAASPALETTNALRDLLGAESVSIHGPPGITEDDPAGEIVAEIHSPELREMLRYTVQRSDNHLADALWRTAGRTVGDGSWSSGGDAALEVLNALGVDTRGINFADGSGLSRDDRITARQLATLDAAMAAKHGAEWTDLKAVAGQSGTLRGRLSHTMARGALHGKTGTLRDVRALAGSVHGPHGRWHFAVLGNHLDASRIHAVRSFSDDLAVVLARHTRACALDGC